MNFYPFHIGDYSSHTKHLTLIEDLAFRRMLDLYYTSENPLPAEPEKVARLIGMREYLKEVSDVISDFFLISERGYINNRCELEISCYKAKSDRAKFANKSRWDTKKSEVDIKSDLKLESVKIPTNNQEPLKNIYIGFDLFWSKYPSTQRKVAKDKCKITWASMKLEGIAENICNHVERIKETDTWKKGFEPAPLRYLKEKRWENEIESEVAIWDR